ncbi:hypothetical protein AOG28_12710 [Cobetia sp. UCD-24C]|nr:hypothetical protein AOG28_12710 [Cobetia sp. UCD-24C]
MPCAPRLRGAVHERSPCAQGSEHREHREFPETALVAVSVLVESLHSRAATQVEQEKANQEKAEQGKHSRDTRRQRAARTCLRVASGVTAAAAWTSVTRQGLTLVTSLARCPFKESFRKFTP